jgi:drug/metabolite transporter (DMT)-like permease
MLLGSVAFAVMAALAHALRDRCDWQVIALARAALQLMCAVGLARIAGVRLVLAAPKLLWLRSLAGSVSMVCMFYAYTRLPVSDVFTLTNTFPLWVALLSWPLLHRPPSVRLWLALASAMVGVVLMQPPDFAERNLATLAALASSVFTAIAMLALNRLGELDARAIVAHFSGVALVCCASALLLFERAALSGQSWDVVSVLFLLGVGLSAVTYQLLLTKAFTAGEAVRVSIVNLTQIVFALVFDVFLFGHTFSGVALLGMTLVVAPTVWLMESRQG